MRRRRPAAVPKKGPPSATPSSPSSYCTPSPELPPTTNRSPLLPRAPRWRVSCRSAAGRSGPFPGGSSAPRPPSSLRALLGWFRPWRRRRLPGVLRSDGSAPLGPPRGGALRRREAPCGGAGRRHGASGLCVGAWLVRPAQRGSTR
jgi:hypothetical protein